MKDLLAKIDKKEAIVGIVGLGYVGLPLAIYFAESGFAVIGFESDETKRKALREGSSYIQDIEGFRLRGVINSTTSAEKERIIVADTFKSLSNCNVIIVCVPTPLAKTKEPDLSFIINAMRVIKEHLVDGQLIVLESTTYPGTTRELVLPLLSGEDANATKKKKEVGKDFYLAFSPERVDPGNKTYNIKNTPKIVGGVTQACGELAQALYAQVVDKVIGVSSADAAEMTKLLENTFRAVNIGLVNEFALMCTRLNVDVWEIINAAASKPFGYIPFYPGPGLGGHCIPIDPLYLSWKLRALDYTAKFIELANEINRGMPREIVQRVNFALNSHGKSINRAKIGILGVSYKKDIDDVRESPALDIMAMLVQLGAKISYHDPFVAKLELHDQTKFSSEELSAAWLKAKDCVVIVTDHTSFNAEQIVKESPLLVDTRNFVARNGLQEVAKEKLFKL